jgi:hypothetical protein
MVALQAAPVAVKGEDEATDLAVQGEVARELELEKENEKDRFVDDKRAPNTPLKAAANGHA